ncbi:hypothetical protein ES707_03731 [subsurface metagenome]
MQQHIGSTKATAWVKPIILSPSPQVKRAKELEDSTKRFHSRFERGEPLNVTTRRLMEPFFGYDLEAVRIHHGHQAEEASRKLDARAFTFRGHIFGPRQTLATSTREGQGLLAHELTHAIQQTQPHRLPQGRLETDEDFTPPTANQATSSVTTPPGSHSGTEMVLLSPSKSSAPTTSPQQGEAQAQANERLVADSWDNKTEASPQINLEEVANKVYCLIQHDLVLERERATKLGG